MKFRNILPVAVMAGMPLASHDIITTKLTYTRDISRIFANRCVACHSENSDIPLTSYEQVRPWAVGIKEQVLSRAMPPWGAVKGFGRFNPDGGLTQEEMMIIAAWVFGGAPKGDLALLRPAAAAATRHILEDLSMKAVPISTGEILESPLRVAGIKPMTKGTVESARIVAHLPDDHIEPLLWLFNYDGRNNRIFRYRNPIDLPAGTSIESTVPLPLELEINAQHQTRAAR